MSVKRNIPRYMWINRNSIDNQEEVAKLSAITFLMGVDWEKEIETLAKIFIRRYSSPSYIELKWVDGNDAVLSFLDYYDEQFSISGYDYLKAKIDKSKWKLGQTGTGLFLKLLEKKI